jgi:hypothetical protein
VNSIKPVRTNCKVNFYTQTRKGVTIASKRHQVGEASELNCTLESGHGNLQLPCIVDSESATWTGKVHDIPTL